MSASYYYILKYASKLPNNFRNTGETNADFKVLAKYPIYALLLL